MHSSNHGWCKACRKCPYRQSWPSKQFKKTLNSFYLALLVNWKSCPEIVHLLHHSMGCCNRLSNTDSSRNQIFSWRLNWVCWSPMNDQHYNLHPEHQILPTRWYCSHTFKWSRKSEKMVINSNVQNTESQILLMLFFWHYCTPWSKCESKPDLEYTFARYY